MRKPMSKKQKEDPKRAIKSVELIYNKYLDSLMVKIKVNKDTIFYPVILKEEDGKRNNI